MRELEGTDGGRVGHRRMDSAVLIWGGVPSHLPSPVSAHIPAGPTEGRHLGVSTGGPGGPPALACCLEPSPCGCLGAEGSGCALLCLGLGSPHGLGVSVSRPVSRSPCTAPQYFTLLLVIFLLEIIAGALAYVYYQQVRGTDRPWATWMGTGTHGDTHVRDGCAHAGDVYIHTGTHTYTGRARTRTQDPTGSSAEHRGIRPRRWGLGPRGRVDHGDGQPACSTQVACLGALAREAGVRRIWSALPARGPPRGHLSHASDPSPDPAPLSRLCPLPFCPTLESLRFCG